MATGSKKAIYAAIGANLLIAARDRAQSGRDDLLVGDQQNAVHEGPHDGKHDLAHAPGRERIRRDPTGR